MAQQLLPFHNRQHPFRLMFPEFSHVLQFLAEGDSLRSVPSHWLSLTRRNSRLSFSIPKQAQRRAEREDECVV